MDRMDATTLTGMLAEAKREGRIADYRLIMNEAGVFTSFVIVPRPYPPSIERELGRAAEVQAV